MRALLVAVALIVPAGALAQTDAAGVYRSTYVQMKLGAALPEDDDLDGFETGLAFDLAVGHFLTPNLAIEAGIGRFRVADEEEFLDPGLGTTVTGKLTLTVAPVTARATAPPRSASTSAGASPRRSAASGRSVARSVM